MNQSCQKRFVSDLLQLVGKSFFCVTSNYLELFLKSPHLIPLSNYTCHKITQSLLKSVHSQYRECGNVNF